MRTYLSEVPKQLGGPTEAYPHHKHVNQYGKSNLKISLFLGGPSNHVLDKIKVDIFGRFLVDPLAWLRFKLSWAVKYTPQQVELLTRKWFADPKNICVLPSITRQNCD